MGTRLTIKVLPKSDAKKIWLMKDWEPIWNIVDGLEQIRYDYCTDAMLDVYKQMKRLTKNKLEVECDIWLGKMGKEEFKIFMDRIKWYAEHQIKESPNPLLYWVSIYETDDPWRLCGLIDWIGAYFDAWYIYKKMDWENNYIFAEIG